MDRLTWLNGQLPGWPSILLLFGTMTGDSIMPKQIQLTQGKTATVDDEDFEYLSQFKWCAHKIRNTFYAERCVLLPNGKHIQIYMHREIMGLKTGDIRQVDHRNRNGLDNQKFNLRISTISQNHANAASRGGSSKYKGVSWHKATKRWRAQIGIEKHLTHIGLFDSEIEAAINYDIYAQKFYGEFAKLNIMSV